MLWQEPMQASIHAFRGVGRRYSTPHLPSRAKSAVANHITAHIRTKSHFNKYLWHFWWYPRRITTTLNQRARTQRLATVRLTTNPSSLAHISHVLTISSVMWDNRVCLAAPPPTTTTTLPHFIYVAVTCIRTQFAEKKNDAECSAHQFRTKWNRSVAHKFVQEIRTRPIFCRYCFEYYSKDG